MNVFGRILVVSAIFAALCAAVSNASDLMFTPNSRVVAVAALNHSVFDMGDVFRYDTAFGRVAVRNKALLDDFKFSIKRKTEVQYSYYNIKTDSYIAGDEVGAVHSNSWSASIKRLIPAKFINRNKGRLALKYTILDNPSISPIHFLDIFETRNIGTLTLTYGAVSNFGNGVKDRISGFGSVEYNPDEKLGLFTEFSGVDFAKIIQAYVVAPAARNVGVIDTGNMGKDALSAGINFFPAKAAGVSFTLYDIGRKARPIIKFTLQK